MTDYTDEQITEVQAQLAERRSAFLQALRAKVVEMQAIMTDANIPLIYADAAPVLVAQTVPLFISAVLTGVPAPASTAGA